MTAPTATPAASPLAAAPQRPAVVVPPGAGDATRAFGNTIQFKLGGAETGGAMMLGLATVPPGGGTPLHRHFTEDELFIVVAGEMEFLIDGAWTPVAPGAVVYLPRGVPHAFRNVGATPSQHWVLTTPSGFEVFYRAAADVFEDAAAAGTPPDVARLMALFAEYRYEALR